MHITNGRNFRNKLRYKVFFSEYYVFFISIAKLEMSPEFPRNSPFFSALASMFSPK